jgi:hypothetical protein
MGSYASVLDALKTDLRHFILGTLFPQNNMACFSTDPANVPELPRPRAIRVVIRDMESGRLHTKTRFGRRHQWKPEESEAFVKTILKGDTLIDPISIGRHVNGGQIEEPAINGNNRLRSLLKFVKNGFGVRAADVDGRIYTYFYSEIPHMETRVLARVRPRVLTAAQRNAFDEYPLMFNCRPNLTEEQEIAWYRDLNTSLHAHSSGHIIVADICDPSPQDGRRAFADALIAHFPAVKDRIEEDPKPEDVASLGAFLDEKSGCPANFMDDADKRENVLLSHAVILNLLVNGTPYSDGWKGVFSAEHLAENVRVMRRIFENATIADDLRAEWAVQVKNKPCLQNFYLPSYLLGPIAYSIATHAPDAEAIWIGFLSLAHERTIAEVYGNYLAQVKLGGDGHVNKYKTAWERVCRYMADRG